MVNKTVLTFDANISGLSKNLHLAYFISGQIIYSDNLHLKMKNDHPAKQYLISISIHLFCFSHSSASCFFLSAYTVGHNYMQNCIYNTHQQKQIHFSVIFSQIQHEQGHFIYSISPSSKLITCTFQGICICIITPLLYSFETGYSVSSKYKECHSSFCFNDQPSL